MCYILFKSIIEIEECNRKLVYRLFVYDNRLISRNSIWTHIKRIGDNNMYSISDKSKQNWPDSTSKSIIWKTKYLDFLDF